MIPTEALLNDFAIRCFRDIADGDYIAARMACRAALLPQFLWASQQALEKYLKCILLLNRIPARHVRHDLGAALRALAGTGKVALDLTVPTTEFIEYLDRCGRFRYLEVSHWGEGRAIVSLDRAVWELRRFCALSPAPRAFRLTEGIPAAKIAIEDGFLERIIGDRKNPARAALVWQNGFFGLRTRNRVRVGGWARGVNAPLALYPELLAEVAKFVFIPKEVGDYYLKAGHRPLRKPV